MNYSRISNVLGRIPNRLALAGGWIDQPFVSGHTTRASQLSRSPSPRPSPLGRGGENRRALVIRKHGLQSPSPESGAEATALQTLRDELVRPSCAKRLDCGAFTAALTRRAHRLSYWLTAALVSPSPGGEGRGEGERESNFGPPASRGFRISPFGSPASNV